MPIVVWRNSFIETQRKEWPLSTLEVGHALILPKGDSRINNARKYVFIRGKALGFKFSCRKTSDGGMAIIRIE